jgi:pyruvate/2-oxoglutarate dehydrogenase complex dihydrolipoamide dehydrogenase (E3) component
MSYFQLPSQITSKDVDRIRIDILNSDESIEEKSYHLLEKLKNGEITVSDLMGPLFCTPDQTPEINIPEGTKELYPTAPESEFLPKDEHNILLDSHVHPKDYINPEVDKTPYDLVAIGGGVSGLISVIIGKWLGKKCALIERHGMGGDCLNLGCVPSKALISCARAVHNTKNISQFGIIIPDGEIKVDFGFIMKRMRSIRAKISHHDSVERYSKDFCKHVFIGEAKFKHNNMIELTCEDGSKRSIQYKKAMIATGASAAIPDIPGLRDINHLTNSNFFNLTELPPRLLVVGCGPIGLELSQCMTRFGCHVTCFETGNNLLPREDKDATDVLRKQLEDDGLNILFNVKIIKVECINAGNLLNSPWNIYNITVLIDNKEVIYEGEAILNATGRIPNVYGLGLENVNVDWDNRIGVHINDMFQTANPDIYACGDCCTAYKFTHSADFQARIAIRNMFLGDSNKLSNLLIPWCTYTEPEIAHVGKYEKELNEKNIKYEIFTRNLADVDRCLCDGVNSGFVKIIIKKDTDIILGATICGSNAGDMISELTLCIQYGIGISQIAGTIHPYPTTQEAIRQCCLGFNKYYKNPLGLPIKTLQLLMNEKELSESK